MSTETKTPREQAEELYRKSQLMAEQDLDVYFGAKQRILDLLTTALTGWQLVPIEECGELAPGEYVASYGPGSFCRRIWGEKCWRDVCDLERACPPTHILNPSFGPLPEVVR